ncbi:hypothetical protein PtA15_4A677 [Puccinia triticina]|uniref:Glutaminase n=1 Tax=Puccinia triticina TaxID=208348 RepID=A0ABY7CHI8_9BASI|nr:uncharacterized protein PtA15_4A677 [Puccinia triticina]WAQ84225.1 hypothetical protein PtA15_4A677 [Puccinia triticina]
MSNVGIFTGSNGLPDNGRLQVAGDKGGNDLVVETQDHVGGPLRLGALLGQSVGLLIPGGDGLLNAEVIRIWLMVTT